MRRPAIARTAPPGTRRIFADRLKSQSNRIGLSNEVIGMPRGGARPGAGRPKGAKSPKALARAKAPKDVKAAAKKSGLSPLDYMLEVMNDAGADDARRDRMAVAAAPFVHAKPSDKPAGKKEAAQAASETAGEGTGWGDDLRPATVN